LTRERSPRAPLDQRAGACVWRSAYSWPANPCEARRKIILVDFPDQFKEEEASLLTPLFCAHVSFQTSFLGGMAWFRLLRDQCGELLRRIINFC
jgi:hypothetical protein